MKKSLLSFLFLSGIISATAQPVFTRSHLYDTGSRYAITTVIKADTINLDTTGSGIVWDLAHLIAGSTVNGTVHLPAGRPGIFNFPNATLCAEELSPNGTTTNSYYRVSDEAVSLIGTYESYNSDIKIQRYNPPLDQYRFPVSPGAAFEQQVDGILVYSIPGDTYGYFRKGSQSVVCDGYGTLITPKGTFENVLRIKTVLDYTDSLDLEDMRQVTGYLIERFDWISAASQGIPLLRCTRMTVNQLKTYSATMADLPVSSIQGTSAGLSFSLFSNPAREQQQLGILLPPTAGEELDAEINSFTGQQLAYFRALRPANGMVQVPLSGMAPGVYLLRLSGRNGSGVQRLVIL